MNGAIIARVLLNPFQMFVHIEEHAQCGWSGSQWQSPSFHVFGTSVNFLYMGGKPWFFRIHDSAYTQIKIYVHGDWGMGREEYVKTAWDLNHEHQGSNACSSVKLTGQTWARLFLTLIYSSTSQVYCEGGKEGPMQAISNFLGKGWGSDMTIW